MLNKNKSRISYLLKGLLMAFIITILLLVFYSLLLRFTSLSESKLHLLNNLTMILSVVVSSIYVAVKIKDKGWMHGGIVGVLYYLIIILINLLFIRDSSSVLLLSKLLISTIAGIIGGMIGINIV
ncbi:TIGR04086 family membrane protein [Tissierella sp. Yu-01]|uniref:TIGR04086 family membrane protein n=1 Tax=Tissierella sp. Yu-01 TaxID=3035694 RepID=UPI00240E4F07|nr:TIGR04086 family membrane protein [Tissierella sp. Yu-01]WFA09850.1 TIGR04086 family membrane protein [Tissierella sp. Yu-01]